MILDCFQTSTQELKLKDFTQELKLSSTVLHRLLNTLVKYNYLTKNPKNSGYSLGMNVYRLGLKANPEPKLRQVSLPYLQKLSKITEETVSLHIVDYHNLTGICIEAIESAHELKIAAKIGLSKELYQGASRKVMMAQLSNQQKEQILNRAMDQGANTDKLKLDLDKIRKQQYAYSEEEVTKGVFNVSVPILTKKGDLLGSLAISSPLFRKADDTIANFSKLLKAAAEEITEQLDS